MHTNFIAIVALVVSVLGLLFQHLGVITDIKERLTRLETKTELFWKCIEENMVKLLKSYPTNPRKDILLDKMLHNELNLESAQELRTVLKGEMDIELAESNNSNALTYVLVISRLEQIIFDKNTGKIKCHT